LNPIFAVASIARSIKACRMRKPLCLRLLAALLAYAGLVTAVDAEPIRFPSAVAPPTPLQFRLARERGLPAPEPAAGKELVGELHRPSGEGRFAAVVLLHGCDGRLSTASEQREAQKLVALGYAVLAVDSFGPRGVRHRCAEEFGAPVDRVMDAYGALQYLASRADIEADRVAVLGYSQGAMTAISAVTRGGVKAYFERHFRAAVAYYPGCDNTEVDAPTLILIGALDEWTPTHNCREMIASQSGAGAPVELFVYSGAYHAFNFPRDRPAEYFGHRLEYNEAADRAAWSETTRFLRQNLGR
jgi:dienelactone hydrolase